MDGEERKEGNEGRTMKNGSKVKEGRKWRKEGW
jgi:hypothetical protein